MSEPEAADVQPIGLSTDAATQEERGQRGRVPDAPVRLWLGGMYWDTESTARATVAVPSVGEVSFMRRFASESRESGVPVGHQEDQGTDPGG